MITNPLFSRAEAARALSCHPERKAPTSVLVATEFLLPQAQHLRHPGKQEAT